MSLEHVKSMVIVFAMPGCGACEEYKPRFERGVNHFIKHGAPMYWYRSGTVPHGVIPVLLLNAASTDPQIVELANQYEISAVPATLLLTHNAKPIKIEGAMADPDVHELLSSAMLANR